LHERSHDIPLTFGTSIVVNGAPYFQVLRSIPFLILYRPLPGDDESPKWRESNLVDVVGRESGYDVTGGSINDCYPVHAVSSLSRLEVVVNLTARPKPMRRTFRRGSRYCIGELQSVYGISVKVLF